ncbi:hypothetical protein [Modestobacter sp. SYSU DS0875]
MSGLAEIDDRLTAAADRCRRLVHARAQAEQLETEAAELDVRLAELAEQAGAEADDVRALEGVSLSRVLAALRGSRAQDLDRERAEADAARLRLQEAVALRDRLDRQLARARAEEAALAGAGAELAAATEAKDAWLQASGTAVGRRLLELAAERGQLGAESVEVGEALAAAAAARDALARVQDRLGSARSWSGWDTFLGGGALASSVKHDRLDQAAAAAADADQQLRLLARELVDVPGAAVELPALELGQLTRFVDIWFDNVFTDWQVGNRIDESLARVGELRQVVDGVGAELDRRATELAARLGRLADERAALLHG